MRKFSIFITLEFSEHGIYYLFGTLNVRARELEFALKFIRAMIILPDSINHKIASILTDFMRIIFRIINIKSIANCYVRSEQLILHTNTTTTTKINLMKPRTKVIRKRNVTIPNFKTTRKLDAGSCFYLICILVNNSTTK